MKKVKLFIALSILCFVGLLVFVPFGTRISAAVKPAVKKKSVTLNVGDEAYSVQLKNVAENAKIKYSSSDKKVVKIKKAKVVPVGAGKATVTVKVTQNGKTYKLKVKFKVAESEEKNPDYDAMAKNYFYDDEIAVLNAITTGDTSLLGSAELSLYNKVIETAEEQKGDTEYDTVKNIHDYIVLNTAYTFGKSYRDVHTLDFAINKGTCVCEGYAKLFYFLCRANGIDCIFMVGPAVNSSGKREDHAWNKVRIDDKWYSIDVTWDDPLPDEPGRVEYYYFLIKDSDIARNHTWDNSGLPEAESTDLGIIYEKYKAVQKFTKEGEAVQYMKTSVAEAYDRNGFTCDIEFLDASDDDVKQAILDLTSEYRSYGCGWSYSMKSAGFYGYYFHVKIYR